MIKQLPIPLQRYEVILGWAWWGFQLLILPVALTMVTAGLPINTAQLNFLFFCVNFIVTTVLFGRFLLSSLKQGLGRVWYTLQAAGLGYAGIQASGVLFSLVILTLYPTYQNLNDSSIMAMVQENFGIMALGTGFLVPVAEEILYRGVIFGSIHRRNRPLAYILSSVVFSLVHILGYIGAYEPVTLLLAFIQYLPSGMCLAWAYARSGSLAAPILIHITMNQLSLMTMR